MVSSMVQILKQCILKYIPVLTMTEGQACIYCVNYWYILVIIITVCGVRLCTHHWSWFDLTVLVFVSLIQLDSTQICWWVCTLNSREFYFQQVQGFFVYPAISRQAWKLTWPPTILVFTEIAFVLGKAAGVWTWNPYVLHVVPLIWIPGFLLLHFCMFLAWCTAAGAVLPFAITVFMMCTVWC